MLEKAFVRDLGGQLLVRINSADFVDFISELSCSNQKPLQKNYLEYDSQFLEESECGCSWPNSTCLVKGVCVLPPDQHKRKVLCEAGI